MIEIGFMFNPSLLLSGPTSRKGKLEELYTVILYKYKHTTVYKHIYICDNIVLYYGNAVYCIHPLLDILNHSEHSFTLEKYDINCPE